MPGFHITARQAQFNKAGYLRRIEKGLQTARYEAIRAFVETLIENVPLWEGTARGSIIPAARLVNVIVDTTPNTPNGYVHPGRGAGVGEALGSARIFGNQYRLGFEWYSEVPHYEVNEWSSPPFPLIHPTPWHSVSEASDAFHQAFADQVRHDIEMFDIQSSIEGGLE